MASTTSATTAVPPDLDHDAPASSVPDNAPQGETLYPPGTTRPIPSLPPTHDTWCTKGAPPLETLLQSNGRLRDEKKKAIKQIESMASQLIGPIKITFSNAYEKKREEGKSTILPSSFYRTAYETSITVSAFTTKDTHIKSRQEPKLKIRKPNAFQAVGRFTIRERLHREGIERHLVWNKVIDPSCYISNFNSLPRAKKRAIFHYKKSQRIGQRVYITEISSAGFVAATVSARCETTVEILTPRGTDLPDWAHFEKHEFDVDIPVWIRDPRKPEHRTDLTEEEFAKLQPEMWISIAELRQSNLKHGPKSRAAPRDCICAKGHTYEWLACGTIPKSRILRVMPFDGKQLYEERTTDIIRSLDSTEPWVWNWEKEMWVLDAAMTEIAEWRDMEAHQARETLKRRADKELDGVLEEPPPPKRVKMIELKIVRPYFDFFRKKSSPAK